MTRWFLLVCALCLFALPLRAQGDAAKGFDKEFKRGYDLLVAGKYEEGMASMKLCLEMVPETNVCAYNLACGEARLGHADAAFEWLGKSVDWGYGTSPLQDEIDHAAKDTDLDSIRADPRYAALVDKMRAQRKAVDERLSTPAIYIPEKLAQATEMPILVVLHPSGATKESMLNARWKKVADDLGLALVAPSARITRSLDPKQGANWWIDPADFVNPKRTFIYEKTVNDAVDAFKKQHKIERARVFLAGESEGGVVALHIAMSQPGLYKGVVAIDSPVSTQMLAEKVPNAVKAGLKVRVVIDRSKLAQMAGQAGGDKADAQKVLDALNTQFTTWGFTNVASAFVRDEKDAQQVDKLALEALRGMQPQAVEAGAPK